jgi:3D (Asp-Asp-Asp) domain-containing protein
MQKSKLVIILVCVVVIGVLGYLITTTHHQSKKINTLQADHFKEQEKTKQLKLEVEKLREKESKLSEAYNGTTQKLEQSESELRKSKDKVKKLEKTKSELENKNQELKKENQELSYKKQIEKQSSSPSGRTVAVSTPKKMPQVSRGSTDNAKTVTMESTAYTAYCNGCSGITATGVNLKSNPNAKVIAVDPSVIPLGTKVHVEGYGYAIAADTGGDIKGNRVDIFFPSKEQAFKWGRKPVNLKILN